MHSQHLRRHWLTQQYQQSPVHVGGHPPPAAQSGQGTGGVRFPQEIGLAKIQFVPGHPLQISHPVRAAKETLARESHTPTPSAAVPANRKNARRDERVASAADALLASSSIDSNLLTRRTVSRCVHPRSRLKCPLLGEQRLDAAPVVRYSPKEDVPPLVD